MNVHNLPIRSHWKRSSTYFANEVYIQRPMQYIFNRLCSIFPDGSRYEEKEQLRDACLARAKGKYQGCMDDCDEAYPEKKDNY